MQQSAGGRRRDSRDQLLKSPEREIGLFLNRQVMRLKAKKLALFVGAAALILIGVVGAPLFVVAAMLGGRSLDYLVAPKDAMYPGMQVGLRDSEVAMLYLGFDQQWPTMFVLVDDEPKEVRTLLRVDMENIGFEYSNIDAGYLSPGGSRARFLEDKIVRLHVKDESLRFSASPEGPFLSLPVEFDEFKKQFGEPDHWRRVNNYQGP